MSTAPLIEEHFQNLTDDGWMAYEENNNITRVYFRIHNSVIIIL